MRKTKAINIIIALMIVILIDFFVLNDLSSARELQKVEILRTKESEHGTFGVLKIDQKVFCVTLEPKNMGNAKNISSIPVQQYICKRIDSPKYGDTFEVQNVPNRNHILFHIGNFVRNTKGCILLGSRYGELNGKPVILNSSKAFSRFMIQMKDEKQFHLTIREVY